MIKIVNSQMIKIVNSQVLGSYILKKTAEFKQ